VPRPRTWPSSMGTLMSCLSDLFPISNLHVLSAAYLFTSANQSFTWSKESCQTQAA
jgi:hypothetical protein